MIRVPALKVAQEIHDRPTQQALGDLQRAVQDVNDNTREWLVSLAMDGGQSGTSGVEAPVCVVREQSSLFAAEVTPDATSGALGATALTMAVYRRSSSGTGQTLLALLDRSSAGATAWSPFTPKALKILSQLVVAAGDVITAIPTSDGAVAHFKCSLTLHFRKVS